VTVTVSNASPLINLARIQHFIKKDSLDELRRRGTWIDDRLYREVLSSLAEPL
jgi:hypothetical protein